MDNSTLSDIQIEEYKKELLRHCPENGRSIGNMALRAKLVNDSAHNWDESLYLDIRKKLIDEGVLNLGRGKGGSVCIANPHLVENGKKEARLYPGVKKCLEFWAKLQGFDNHVVVETANQGRADTGGFFSRPDLACFAIRHYEYAFMSGSDVELITFEVESEERADARAVYEALAQGRDATSAYVVFYLPEGSEKAPKLDQAISAATRHGVGLIVVTELFKEDGWDEIVNPIKQVPQPYLMYRFVNEQLKDAHEDIKQMLGTKN